MRAGPSPPGDSEGPGFFGLKLGMHSLRKGFGCRYAGKVPAQVLQQLMRHSDISVTMDDDASVGEAVRGSKGVRRNTTRNRGRAEAPQPNRHEDANP